MSNIGLESRLFTINEIDEFISIAKPGDKIQFDRGMYSHYAIYEGLDENGEPFIINLRLAKEHPKTWWDNAKQKFGTVYGDGKKGVIRRESLRAFLREGEGENEEQFHKMTMLSMKTPTRDGVTRFRINNSTDRHFRVRREAAIVGDALRAADGGELNGKYALLFCNCQHFANECRHGREDVSEEVDGAMKGLGALQYGFRTAATASGALLRLARR